MELLPFHLAFLRETVGTLFLITGGFMAAMLAMILIGRAIYDAWGGD
jgi:hypothetical protein